MDFEETIQKIIEKTGRARNDIKKLIQEQIEELSGLIDEEGAIVIVAKNLGIDLKSNQEAANMEVDQKIIDLKPRMNANTVGRIVEIEDIRKFNKKDGSQGVLLPFIIEDTSNMIRCLAWGENHAQILQENGFSSGEIVRIVNGFIKEGRTGALEIHIGGKSRIQLQPDNVDYKLIPDGKNSSKISITPLGKISIKMPYVNIQGIVSSIFSPKEFSRKDGSKGKRASIAISENENSVYITFWGDHCEKINDIVEGHTVQITRLTPKPNYKDNSKIDLTATSNTTIIIQNGGNINHSSVKPNAQPGQIITIQELNTKGGFGSIEGKIQDIDDIKTINLRDGSQKNILKFVLADKTDAIRVNVWGEKIPETPLKVGDVLSVESLMAKINSYSNQMEATLTRNGVITQIDKIIETNKTIAPIASKNAFQKLDRKNIEDITEPEFYEFKGSIIKEINRITTYSACSTCNRKYENCKCDNPGDQVNRMIINLLLDDESSTIRATLMGERAEKFIGEKTDRIVELQEGGELESFLKERNKSLVGKEFVFRGKARFSNYSESYEISINSFEELNVEMEASRILSLLE
ncbi:hypothetical protein [Candidatus Lokiarchaeum ossiferum]|uniref:hypothetical protein n=1 Tax=Candidatus Lokiarchaeum ossiferum TaxID=2951803 RepID=UPI00352FAB52